MIDTDAALIDYLNTKPGLTVHTDQRFWASVYYPKEYDPSDGKGLLFSPRTGATPDYSGLTLLLPYQFRSYGQTQAQASELDRALYDVLHEAQNCNIKLALAEAVGQPLIEPGTRWPFVLSYYQIWFNNT
jgi:hypothetical protein